MRVSAVVVFCLALLLAGCVPQTSLHQFYLEKDLVLEPSLNGSWVMQGENEEGDEDKAAEGGSEGDPFEGSIWTFEQAENKAYSLHVAGKTTGANFAGHLFRLGEALYLDLLPRDFDPELPASTEECPVVLVFAHLFSVHGVFRVKLDGDRLLVGSLDDNWVKGHMGPQNPIAHIEREGSVLLTAAPEDLSKLLGQTPADWDAFLGPFELVRQSPPPAPAP